MAKKKDGKTFEEALAKLEAIVEAIEEGRVGLEESIKKYEEGMALVKHCRAVLSSAEERISKLQLSADGQFSATPLEGPGDAEPDDTGPDDTEPDHTEPDHT